MGEFRRKSRVYTNIPNTPSVKLANKPPMLYVIVIETVYGGVFVGIKTSFRKKKITNPNYGIKCTVPMLEYLVPIIEMNKKALRILAKRGI
ncbi:hypothetical protein VQ056_24395 [Paenibacillus sp. JTLBN-2024]